MPSAWSTLNYTTEEVIKKYPDTGLSEVRYYKYITLSKNKNEKNADSRFEAGGIVFVDEKLNLAESEPEDIAKLAVAGIPSDYIMNRLPKNSVLITSGDWENMG